MSASVLAAVLAASAAAASDTPPAPVKTVVNRPFRLSLPVESPVAIRSMPYFTMPPECAVLESHIIRDAQQGAFRYRFEATAACTKAGTYNAGPFVLYDIDGMSHTLPPVTIDATAAEPVPLPKSVTLRAGITPRISTYFPDDDLYPGGWFYIVCELPSLFDDLTLVWSGAPGFVVEKAEERVRPGGELELKYLVVAIRQGTQQLPLPRVVLKNENTTRTYESDDLEVDVLPPPQAARYTGDYRLRMEAVTGTNKEGASIEVSITGTGYIPLLSPPELAVTPPAPWHLVSVTPAVTSQYPRPAGSVKFRYVLLPSAEGRYAVAIKHLGTINPAGAAFSVMSSASSLLVHPTSNPSADITDGDLKQRLGMRTRPDYEFFGFLSLGGLVLVAFVVWAFRFIFKRREPVRRSPASTAPSAPGMTTTIDSVQRAVLKELTALTGRNLHTAPVSQVRSSLGLTRLSEETRKDVIDWLTDVNRVRYLKDGSSDEAELHRRGLAILAVLRATSARRPA